MTAGAGSGGRAGSASSEARASSSTTSSSPWDARRSARASWLSNTDTRASRSIASSRAAGCPGSNIRNAPPALSTPNSATARSGVRSRCTPTSCSGRTPIAMRCRASWLARASSCAYVSVASPSATATASGVARACASKRRCARSGATAGPVGRHASITWRRSSGVSRGSAVMACPGCAVAPASSVSNCPSIRAMVSASKRSVAYSHISSSPSPESVTESVRSSLVAPVSPRALPSVRPGRCTGWDAASWRTSFTWKRGACARLRSGLRPRTIASKGRSWCAHASRVARWLRCSSSWKDGAPERSPRSGSWLTNSPTMPAVSGRTRCAVSTPTTTSSCPV
ncbi:hypothetical protein COSO111634_30215 [Corallococcus soli]